MKMVGPPVTPSRALRCARVLRIPPLTGLSTAQNHSYRGGENGMTAKMTLVWQAGLQARQASALPSWKDAKSLKLTSPGGNAPDSRTPCTTSASAPGSPARLAPAKPAQLAWSLASAAAAGALTLNTIASVAMTTLTDFLTAHPRY